MRATVRCEHGFEGPAHEGEGTAALGCPDCSASNGGATVDAYATRVQSDDPFATRNATVADDGPCAVAPGRTDLPGYELLGEIGRGGMGVVYKARDRRLDRVVALKMVLAGDGAGDLERLRREAETVARLQHPNIVQIYEVGEAGGRPFFAMEFVDGGTLAKRINGQPQPVRAAAIVTQMLARALHYAHERGVIHRDLKPANILLAGSAVPDARTADYGLRTTDFGIPKITDFGLAKRMDAWATQTHTGAVLGTPSYMAPEQATGRARDVCARTDVYGLGAVLYELLTGRPPFRAETPLSTLKLVAAEEPVAPGRLRPGVPADLQTIVLKCLEKEPAKRYATALDLAEDLRRFVASEPIRARPVGRWQRAVKWARRRPAVAALVAVSVAAVLALAGAEAWFHARVQAALAVARAERLQAVERLVRLNVASGMRLADDGNLQGALPYLVEALRLDGDEPARASAHRIRLAAVLQQCPRPAQMWFHAEPVHAAAFSPDGQRAVTGGDDGRAGVWDVTTGAPAAPALEHGSPVRWVAFSPDGRRVLTAGEEAARLWDAATGRPLGPPLRPADGLTAAVLCPDGRRVVTGGSDGAVRTWDGITGREVSVPRLHGTAVRHVAVSADGRALASVGGPFVRLWDPDADRTIRMPLRTLDGRGAWFSPHGRRLVTAGGDGVARLWDVSTGRPLGVPLFHGAPILLAAFSPDGERVVTAGDAGTARVWSADTGALVGPPLRHTSTINHAAFSPDGRRVVTASDDNTARVWDVATGKPLTPLWKHNGTVYLAAFSPDGAWVLTASLDGTARLWPAGPAAPPPAAGRLSAALQREALSADRRRAVRPEARNAVRVWDLATGSPLTARLEHGSAVQHAAFSPDGTRVVTASDDNTARVWDAATGRPLTPPLKHQGTVYCAIFSPDGRSVLTGSADGTARFWDAATGDPLTPARPPAGWVRRALLARDRVPDWRLPEERRSLEELTALAELLAGHRIDPTGGCVAVEPDELRARWRECREAVARP